MAIDYVVKSGVIAITWDSALISEVNFCSYTAWSLLALWLYAAIIAIGYRSLCRLYSGVACRRVLKKVFFLVKPVIICFSG